MFGLGFIEVMVIIIVMIVVIKPSDYTLLIRKTAVFFKECRNFKNRVLRELSILDVDTQSPDDTI